MRLQKKRAGFVYISLLLYYSIITNTHNERGVENVLRPSNALGGDERQPGPDGRHERAAGAVGRRRGLRGVLDDRYEFDDDVRDVWCFVSRVISSSSSSSNRILLSRTTTALLYDANCYYFFLTICAVAPLSSCASSSRSTTTYRR